MIDIIYFGLYFVYKNVLGLKFSQGSNIITEILALAANFILEIFQWILSNLFLGRLLFSGTIIFLIVLCNFVMFILPVLYRNRKSIKDRVSQRYTQRSQTVNPMRGNSDIETVPQNNKKSEAETDDLSKGNMDLF